jgi:hypothetical protein
MGAYDYINAIPVKLWAYYAFPASRYGHDPSNINESLNQVYSEIRYMQPLQLLNAIWHKTMTAFFERSRRKQKGSDLADIPSAKYLTRQQTSQRYKVYPSDDNNFKSRMP